MWCWLELVLITMQRFLGQLASTSGFGTMAVSFTLRAAETPQCTHQIDDRGGFHLSVDKLRFNKL
jgi:hypothetical protein